jgi:hypothetical protein
MLQFEGRLGPDMEKVPLERWLGGVAGLTVDLRNFWRFAKFGWI